MSAPEKLMKGNTVSLTETDSGVSYENPISLNFCPSMSQVAYFAKGCPIDLLTNGTVLEARGLTSIRKISSSLTANCMFINPFTRSSLARIFPCSSNLRNTSEVRFFGGRIQALSPE